MTISVLMRNTACPAVAAMTRPCITPACRRIWMTMGAQTANALAVIDRILTRVGSDKSKFSTLPFSW
ncbi:hypothetical protein ACE0DR_29100 [Azotobacter sp. CWF10]